MEILKEEELEEMKGGFGWLVAVGIVALAIFAVGVLSGITNPKSCGCSNG